jgi:hypothetical protein
MATLTSAQREILAAVLSDAIEYRTPGADCTGCDVHPGGLCEDHAGDLDRTDAYIALGRDLDIEAGG